MITGRCRVRVRYSDTDAMGVAHHSRYLNWFEVGRTELMRLAGWPYSEVEKQGFLLPLVGIAVRFKAPGRYDDVLEIESRVEAPPRARITFEYTITRADDGAVVATGHTEHAVVDKDFKPRRMAAALQELLSSEQDVGSPGGPC